MTVEVFALESDPYHFVDRSLPIPKPYRGTGPIQLIVLGQDPTVKNVEARKEIKIVLNLDKRRSIWSYLAGICNTLDLKLDTHIYATNLYKNFFTAPPTQIKEIDVFQAYAPIWLPILEEEIKQFPNVPIITLGEPLLAPLLKPGVIPKVRHYWGYRADWQSEGTSEFEYIRARDNLLERDLFPFPHQPSLRKSFYKAKLKDYTAFVRSILPRKV